VRRLAGLGIMAVCLAGGLILQGGHLSSVMQLTSFIIVAGGILAARIVGFPFSSPTSHTGAARRRSAMARAAIGAGVAGMIFGIVHAMTNLHTPDLIGPGLAVALVSLVYGSLLWLIFKAGECRHAANALARGETVPSRFDQMDAGAVASGALMALLFVVFVVLNALHVPGH
jgi:flagellar motor component MotA